MARAGPWLADSERAWVEQNGFLLEAIWRHFHESGEWPEPVELQRRLHVENPDLATAKAVASMPRTLVVDEWAQPRHLALTIFGLGCCPGAQRLLRRYLEASHLALRRFGSPELPNRLTRAELVEALTLGELEVELLSIILMRDADFLGSGDSNIDSWDRAIDTCVVEFAALEEPDDLLAFLAERRHLGAYAEPAPGWAQPQALAQVEPPPPGSVPQPAAVPSTAPSERPDSDFLLGLFSTLAGLASVVITAAAISATFAGFLAAALLIAAALLYWLFRRRPPTPLLAAAALLAVVAVVLGLMLESPSRPRHYRYFVTDTTPHAVVIPRIEPRPAAPYAEGGTYGIGAQVIVSCTERSAGRPWAKLSDASYLELSALTAEFASTGEPPSC